MKNIFLLTSIFSTLFLAPDGAGAGAAQPAVIPVEEWIERLKKADKKDRKSIVEEMGKALGLSIGDTYKKLKEAGWDPNAKPSDDKDEGEKKTVTLRHKTPHPHYRRAGLVLTSQPKPYQVTEGQLAALKKDPWVEIAKE
jgi:hypothetical protein